MGVLWQVVIVSLGVSTTLAASIPTTTIPTPEERALAPRNLTKRADDDFNPWDLSHLTKIAAIGDSYSAGIGAGNRLGNNYDPTKMGAWACSRYDKAYPNLVNENSALGDSSKRKFQFDSCSGALAKDVTDSQVKRLDDGQDVIMLSAGGNDAGLVDVLNQCVYQIFAPTKETAGLMETNPAFEGIEWLTDGDVTKYTRTCEDTLEDSKKLIEGDDFSSDLDSLLSKTKEKLADDGTIYYTGYAHFWSDSMSDDDACSKKSWSVFHKGDDEYVFQEAVKLTVDRRKKMNELVDAVNKKIAEAVKKAGDQVVFVDYDVAIRTSGGQFCEKGVDEPNASRAGLMFYELDISDPLGMAPFKRDGDDAYEGTFEYNLNRLAELAFTAGSKLEDGTLAHNATDTEENSEGKRFVDAMLPDGWKRIFHPTINAHKQIAELLVYHMAITNSVKHYADASPPTPTGQCSTKPTGTEDLNPECNKSVLSGVAYNVFNGVYGKFCEEIDKDQREDKDNGRGWVVDSHGEKKPIKKRGWLEGRTPPPNPDSYSDFNFELVWDRNDDKGKGQCVTSCKKAYETITLTCGHTGGEQNGMAREASLSTDCGKYSYRITGSGLPDQTDPKHVERKCFDKDDIKDPGAVSSEKQAEYIPEFCDKTKGVKLKAGDQPIEYKVFNGNDGLWYYYVVGWAHDCQTSVKEMDAEFPLGEDHKNNCRSLTRWTYKLCGDNGGIGGWYEVGCLRYAFIGGAKG